MQIWRCIHVTRKDLTLQSLVRFLSTPTSQPLPPTNETEINKNISIVQHVATPETSRPMVLLIGWLFAKPSHLRKYCDFYIRQGFDVVSVKVHVGQVLLPKRVQLMVRNVLDICQDADRKLQPILVHGFSVGGYVFGEMLTTISDFNHKYGDIERRIYGQILDSPIDFYGIPKGIARALTENKRMAVGIQNFLEWYLTTFKGITCNYIRASQMLRANDLKIPTKLFYSLSDPLCDAEEIERVASTWRENGTDAETEFWKKAAHVSTFRKYPEEYTRSVIEFIWRTGIKRHNPLMDICPDTVEV